MQRLNSLMLQRVANAVLPRAHVSSCSIVASRATITRSFTTTAPIVDGDASSSPSPSQPSDTTSLSQSTSSAPTSAPHSSLPVLLPLLRSQPPFYASIHLHGRPYLVTAGDTVRLPFRMPDAAVGSVLRLNRASILGSRDFTLKGAPWIDERLFVCRATVIGVETEPLRLKIKKKQRTRRTKTVKSKMRFTVLRVSELVINDLPSEPEA